MDDDEIIAEVETDSQIITMLSWASFDALLIVENPANSSSVSTFYEFAISRTRMMS